MGPHHEREATVGDRGVVDERALGPTIPGRRVQHGDRQGPVPDDRAVRGVEPPVWSETDRPGSPFAGPRPTTREPARSDTTRHRRHRVSDPVTARRSDPVVARPSRASRRSSHDRSPPPPRSPPPRRRGPAARPSGSVTPGRARSGFRTRPSGGRTRRSCPASRAAAPCRSGSRRRRPSRRAPLRSRRRGSRCGAGPHLASPGTSRSVESSLVPAVSWM